MFLAAVKLDLASSIAVLVLSAFLSRPLCGREFYRCELRFVLRKGLVPMKAFIWRHVARSSSTAFSCRNSRSSTTPKATRIKEIWPNASKMGAAKVMTPGVYSARLMAKPRSHVWLTSSCIRSRDMTLVGVRCNGTHPSSSLLAKAGSDQARRMRNWAVES